jgi:hypothetical protein
MTTSSRSTARRSGFWQFQPNAVHFPDMRGVIAHGELLVNQFGHLGQRPEIGPVPGVQRASGVA